ncbi:MAG: DUF3348 family protein [Gammaproteobacteria bacterium]|uniref:DUF3348 family protein n=1 Tax=Pseudacidovorax sp. TaxID=1934311 RepID=UPI001B538E43|nr:DUF3348 family protein [Pseudacidovorax sp.]MBP6896572.1 DUF3348 domain-containing protein [Pseudacidovorax sp.]
MALTTVRTGLTGAALVRLLAGLAGPRAQVRDSRDAFADRLSHWLGWTDAISLSAALERPLPAPSAAGAPSTTDDPWPQEQAEVERVRAVLAHGHAKEAAAAGRSTFEQGIGFSPYRQRYLARQQAMEMAIGLLRERLRAVVAARSPELARLAAVDAVMAQTLGPHEDRLMAGVAPMLEKHFRRLAEAHGPEDESWQEPFRQDLHTVLLAELELRMQPALALLEALRPPGAAAPTVATPGNKDE